MGGLEGQVDDFFPRVKQATDIVELLGEHIPSLKKTGSTYKGLCPFHEEKTPSFIVNPVNQYYHCFGCDASGDAIRFIEDKLNLTPWDAAVYLAQKSGIPVPQKSGQRKKIAQDVYEVLDVANAFYKNLLHKTPAALDYVQSRGITSQEIEEWELGYAPEDWSTIAKHLHDKGFKIKDIVLSGLIKQSDRMAQIGRTDITSYYDRFRERIMFPIRSQTGRLEGFTARSIDQTKNAHITAAKYVNSPGETEVGHSPFHKDRILYGLYKAADHIKKQGFVYVTEGPTDVILSRLGNAIATLGTAFTQEHAKMLKRITNNILLIPDNDHAGIKAAKRSASISFGQGLDPKVILLPQGQDLGDMSVQHKDKLPEFLETQTQYNIASIHVATMPKQTTGEKFEIIEAIAEHLKNEKRVGRREMYITQAAEELGVNPASALKIQYQTPSTLSLFYDDRNFRVDFTNYLAAYAFASGDNLHGYDKEIPPNHPLIPEELKEIYALIITAKQKPELYQEAFEQPGQKTFDLQCEDQETLNDHSTQKIFELMTDEIQGQGVPIPSYLVSAFSRSIKLDIAAAAAPIKFVLDGFHEQETLFELNKSLTSKNLERAKTLMNQL